MDVIGFVAGSLVSTLGALILYFKLSPKIQPEFWAELISTDTDEDKATEEKAKERNPSDIAALFVLYSSLASVVVVYPTVLMPVYCSDVFTDCDRLVFCLVAHPLILEFILHKLRISTAARYVGSLAKSKKKEDLDLLFCIQHKTMFVEAILVFNRRFMLGLMNSQTATTFGIVLTAIEETASRVTMVERDRWFRKRSGAGDYTGSELAAQHTIWTAQINMSMIIEIAAILLHTACVVLYLPHRFIFNLGYGRTESFGYGGHALVVILNMLLELFGEVVTDAMSLRSELESGVPVDKYFERMKNPVQVIQMFGSILMAAGIVLWTFTRVPTSTFCDTPDPCSCLDHSSSNFEIYREVCELCSFDIAEGLNETGTARNICANLTEAASTRFVTNPTHALDVGALLQIGLGATAFTATALATYAAVAVSRKKRALQQVQVFACHNEALLAENRALKETVALFPSSGRELQALKDANFNDLLTGITKIGAHAITLEHRIASGTSGEVLRAKFSGVTVAVKRLKSSQITTHRLKGVAREIVMCSNLSHHCIVGFLGASWDNPSNIMLVYEYLSRGDVSMVFDDTDLASQLTWAAPLASMCCQVAEGMAFIHEKGALHRDLKDKNVLVNSVFHAKICDLGSSRVMEGDTITAEGTPLFMAPEALRGEKLGFGSDVWSFGVLLTCFATRKRAYHDHPQRENSVALVHLIANKGLKPELPDGTPECVLRVVQTCFSAQPEDRPTFESLEKRLRMMKFTEDVVAPAAKKVGARDQYEAQFESCKISLDEAVLPRVLGQGAFGVVTSRTWNGIAVAAKKLIPVDADGDAKAYDEVAKEVTLLQKVAWVPVSNSVNDEPAVNIARFFGWTFEGNSVVIVLELCEHGNLKDYLKKMSADEAKDFPWLRPTPRQAGPASVQDAVSVLVQNTTRLMLAQDVAAGLGVLHTNDVLHRDLKTENILLGTRKGQRLVAKLSDFGLSREETLEQTMTVCGTPFWMAPEVLCGERYSRKVDIYSFGVFLWELASRELPFAHLAKLTTVEIVGAVVNEDARPECWTPQSQREWKRCPAGVRKLIEECWHPEGPKRPLVDEVIAKLTAL